LIQFDHPLASVDSRIEVSPSWISHLTMQIEFAVFAADHLVAEDRQLLVEVIAIESEDKFVFIW
jgi:hypothetical protein